VQSYWGISVVDIAVKLFAIILLNHFNGAREKRTLENQAASRPGRGFSDNIFFAICLIIQQFEKYNLPLILMFLNFVSTFAPIIRQALWKIV